MKIAIIGAGLIGVERIIAINQINKNYKVNIEICIVIDNNNECLKNINNKYKLKTSNNIFDAINLKPDWMFLCIPHHEVYQIINECFKRKINVLLEKPLGRSLYECEEIINLKPDNTRLAIGFNYKFFKSINSILNDIKTDKFGKLISVNMILAHGNSPDIKSSWKIDPVMCGGGALIDPGIHLLNLVQNLGMGNIEVIGAMSGGAFWNSGIEEEVHLILRDQEGVIFNIQSSLVKWRSTFRLEVNGVDGYGIVEGRGRSYGPQTYICGERWGWLSGKKQVDTEIVIVDKDDATDSFYFELLNLFQIENSRNFPSNNNLNICDEIEGLETMRLLDKCQIKLNLKPYPIKL